MKYLGECSMLSKLLKNDLKKNMRWLWIIFVTTIAIALLDRGCKELANNIAFFKIISIILDSVFYSLAVNTVLQPFLRNTFNFTKSFYSDESYLTHTLPVTKKQLINSKYITALIEVVTGFAVLVSSILIMYASPSMFDTLQLLLSTVISGNLSIYLILALMAIQILVEFLMFLSIIYFAIVIAYREKEQRVLKTFLITFAMASIALTILSIVMVIIMLINGIDLASDTLILSPQAFLSIIFTGISVYSIVTVVFYFLTKKMFTKGVNVD